jgi:hypothetical protein
MNDRIVHANGVDLCIETFGDPADPALLLSHGAGNSMLSWDEELSARAASPARTDQRGPRRRAAAAGADWARVLPAGHVGRRGARHPAAHRGQVGCPPRDMAVDLVIDIENTPGALAQVAAAISDAGVNIAAATCIGAGERAELHILVPHAGAARHSLAISHVAVTREREVVVVDVEDRPGVLADLTRRIARAGVDLDLVYVATRNRVVFGAGDLAALRAALDDGA